MTFLNSTILAEMGRRQMTQVALAEKIGISAITLRRRLEGSRDWTMNSITAISDAFGMKPSQLMALAEQAEEGSNVSS